MATSSGVWGGDMMRNRMGGICIVVTTGDSRFDFIALIVDLMWRQIACHHMETGGDAAGLSQPKEPPIRW
jgi:hypothetical protein